MQRSTLTLSFATLALAGVGPTSAAPPVKVSCGSENRVRISYCCPEQEGEALETVRFVAANLCLERDLEYYEVIEESTEMETSQVRSSQINFSKQSWTADLEVELHAYDEVGRYICRSVAESIEERRDGKQMKSLRSLLAKAQKQLAKLRAEGECP
jgi:hypothetical protein